MSKIGISIILPTLNEEDNLSLIIPEIISKFDSNNLIYEIVVVDDNSLDNTEKIMNEFVTKNQNIKLISKTGVHRISVGAITHSTKSFDTSLRFKDN